MFTENDFRAAVEKCLAEHGFTPTSFGKAAVGDPTFVFELRSGRSCGLKIVNKVMGFIADCGKERAA